MPTHHLTLWQQLVPVLIVVAIVVVRMLRPQRISVTRMWVTPIVLAALAAFAIYGSARFNPAPAWEIAVGLAIGALAGIPVGLLRGHHTEVQLTERDGTMLLGSSWITALIYFGAFGLREGIRLAMPQRGSLAAAVGDGLLAFAIGYIVASYVAIYRKYEAKLRAKASGSGGE